MLGAATHLLLIGCGSAAVTVSASPLLLVQSAADDRDPAWSPDGKHLAFQSDRDGNWEVYVTAVGGAASPRRVTDHPAADVGPNWSPSGDRLVFASDRDGRSGIYVADLASGAVEQLFTSNEAQLSAPHWSPAGQRIAFTQAQEGVFNVALLALPTKEVRPLPGGSSRDLWGRWSPDGREIVYFSRRPPHPEDDELYLWREDGSVTRRLTQRPGHDFCPSWSPDGKWIVAALVGAQPGPALAVYDRRGTMRALFGHGFDAVTAPSWSPDGRRIAFAGRQSGKYDVFVVDVVGVAAPAAGSGPW